MITAVSVPCWTLADGHGTEFGTCYGSSEEAQHALDTTKRHLTKVSPAQRENPCVSVRCSECSTGLDEEGEGYVFHFDTDDEARKMAAEFEWTSNGNKWTCPGCREDI